MRPLRRSARSPTSVNFNPRTPCGVRLRPRRTGVHHRGHFNPRTPCGVRLDRAKQPGVRIAFQSTHPLRGATSTLLLVLMPARFQSTHPLRGATDPASRRPWNDSISIHAPLAGCDRVIVETTRPDAQFQSTHPLRGATNFTVCWSDKYKISIHAPLAGCDANGHGGNAGA